MPSQGPASTTCDPWGIREQTGSGKDDMQALRRLEEKEILKEITGRERNRVYVAAGILEIME